MLTLKLTGDLEDLRALRGAGLYDPDPARDAAAQRIGAGIRARGGDGLVYASLRRPGGDCAAGFRPDRFSDCRHVRMVQFYWDGSQLLTGG